MNFARNISRKLAPRVLSLTPRRNYTFGRLDGKVIVVAGAGNPPAEGHGIGATTSLVLARHGAKVVSVSFEPVNVETVTNAIQNEVKHPYTQPREKSAWSPVILCGLSQGNEGFGAVADCTKAADVQSLVEQVMKQHGRVDCVINAGIHSALPMGFGKMDEANWERGIDLNLNAHYHLIHKFLPVFQKQGSGNFIHFTTIASSVGLGIGRQRHAYAAGKAAAATLTKRIGVEYAKEGIRGNVIGKLILQNFERLENNAEKKRNRYWLCRWPSRQPRSSSRRS
jgi:NAD(P)-dependent dehydrogenase (short-subunit alcohol dehydrogenase family)